MTGLAPLVVILGPTASGKSALGIELAKKFNGEVLVCDSTQIYKHFDVGTGKIPQHEQQGIAHHLVDLIDPQEIFTAGEYRRRAETVLADLRQRGKLPIVTAGTGLYLRALLLGLADTPERSETIRARLRASSEKHGPTHLHRVLARLDPQSAARINSADEQKTIRAIEMRILAGKTVDELFAAGRDPLPGFRPVKIGLSPPRELLYTRIHQRIDAMMQAGWIAEVAELVQQGIPPEAKPFQFIGYSDWREYLVGKISKDEARNRIQQSTRRFAKRQLTWFRREPDVHWLEGFGESPESFSAAIEIINSHNC
ncbi:MAG TPA: tRNA (adenosine(37)-N6)-dimethylallyltransferase MiaA [Candidatus Acidoferrales bacterium]